MLHFATFRQKVWLIETNFEFIWWHKIHYVKRKVSKLTSHVIYISFIACHPLFLLPLRVFIVSTQSQAHPSKSCKYRVCVFMCCRQPLIFDPTVSATVEMVNKAFFTCRSSCLFYACEEAEPHLKLLPEVCDSKH